MENTPEAAGAAQAPQTEATPITNSAPSQAQVQTSASATPDMHGFTSDQLADMKKFFEANGGFDKIKAKISNPAPKVEQNVLNTPAPNVNSQQPVQAQQPSYQAPVGSITREEFLAQEYAQTLARDPAFAPISDEISSGAFLKDMAKLNIRLVNQDGSLNDGQVREYLKLKAATIPAKQTNVTPEASAAPTVDYLQYDEKNMTMEQAVKILQQDTALKGQGRGGNPDAQKAEEFMRNLLNKGKK